MTCALIPDVFPVLEGEGLTLRALREEDLPAWFSRLSDAESASLAGDPVATSIDQVVQGLQYHRRSFREKQSIRWSIIPDELGMSVGSIGFSEFACNERGASVGAAIGRAHWGGGIATRAGRIALAYAFTTLQLSFVWAVVLPENTRVLHVLGKLGFSLDDAPAGIMRNIGNRTDTLYYCVHRPLA